MPCTTTMRTHILSRMHTCPNQWADLPREASIQSIRELLSSDEASTQPEKSACPSTLMEKLLAPTYTGPAAAPVPGLLTLPRKSQRSILNVCLEEPQCIPTAASRVWSCLDEAQGPVDSWVGFIHEMASYQDTWTPSVKRSRKRPRQDLPTEADAQTGIQDERAIENASNRDKDEEREQWLAVCADIGRRLARAEGVSHEGVEAACGEALRELHGHSCAGLMEQEAWGALALGERSEAVIAALCRVMAGERDGSLLVLLLRVVRGFLMHVLRPRVLGLQAPASRVLAEGMEAVAKQWPRALLDYLLLPLLLTGEGGGTAPGWAQCEVCIRLIKKGALPQVELQYLLSCLCGMSRPPCSDYGGGFVWTDSTMGVLTSVLSCQPLLSDATLTCLLEGMEAALEQSEEVTRSLKLVGLVNGLIGRYRQRLLAQDDMMHTLERVADKSAQPMIRAAVAKLK